MSSKFLEIVAVVVSTLILVLGVPSRFKYAWQGNRVRRRKSAGDVSRKFHIVSFVIYVLQVIHNTINHDWVNVIFWSVGVFTVGYCIIMCHRYWYTTLPFWEWVIDSFQGKEEGGIWG